MALDAAWAEEKRRTGHWVIQCSVCGEWFAQLHRGPCGRRALVCDLKICELWRNFRNKNKAEPPAWMQTAWKARYGTRRRQARTRTQAKNKYFDSERVARKEQAIFEKEQHRIWVERVRKVAADNTDLPTELLAERFGVSTDQIRRVLGREDSERRSKKFSREDAARARAPGWIYGAGWHTSPRRSSAA